jgi:hypothetical protein
MMLEQIGIDIWVAEGEIVNFHGFPYPTRAVIVRLEDGALWVWSPIRLTPELQSEVDDLSGVTHLVSPNKIHHLYLADWLHAYPQAALWGPQSTIDKHKDLRFREALGDTPPSEWGAGIEQFWFRGSFAMDEIVFFHRPSRTAILADLSENFSEAFLRRHWSWWQRRLATIGGITEGKGLAPLEWRWSFWRRQHARVARDRLLACEPEKVIMAHGEWRRSNGRAFLEQSLAWLGE